MDVRVPSVLSVSDVKPPHILDALTLQGRPLLARRQATPRTPQNLEKIRQTAQRTVPERQRQEPGTVTPAKEGGNLRTKRRSAGSRQAGRTVRTGPRRLTAMDPQETTTATLTDQLNRPGGPETTGRQTTVPGGTREGAQARQQRKRTPLRRR
jgi:hypothetical protein